MARLARVLLHVRYVFGYLAAGFLVSVPISIGSKVGYGLTLGDALRECGLSIAYGGFLLLPFFALIPVSRIDWKAMNVPEFQLFELSVTRTATLVAAALFLVSAALRQFTRLAEPRVAWTVVVLMLFAWGRIKVQTLIFPEFYELEPKA